MRKSSYWIAALIVSLLLLPPHPARAANQRTLDQYVAHLHSLQALVQSCSAKPALCNAKSVGGDDRVRISGLGAGANTNSFQARYDWLRQTLRAAHDPKEKGRADQLQSAEARLSESLHQASSAAPAGVDFKTARQKANKILSREEFATVREDSLWNRLGAYVGMWLDRFFNHVAQFGKHAPWIGPLLEFGFLGLALIALIVWAMRAFKRQRLAVRIEAHRQMETWEEAARNWRALADEQAAQGDWREAVHCMYWATIAMLEGRRFWVPNRARTPREYLRLLESGSEHWKLLRQQTSGFEHIWYGLHDAAAQDYERAVQLHEGLKA
ncbi:MAG TPA: DUF4129 domain-containing protein [Acidobacteriaceae bacterium]|nr:DUF4129 domain-containing protein [Acidobacteriaceae bacterium]